jgi:hypothetical protein
MRDTGDKLFLIYLNLSVENSEIAYLPKSTTTRPPTFPRHHYAGNSMNTA